jgi:signal transduction histidine kinase
VSLDFSRPEPGRTGRFTPRSLSLHTRIATALLTVGALLLGVVAVSAVVEVQTQHEQREVVYSYYNGLRFSQTYFIDMLNAETAVRGYALTGGRPDMLGPLQQSGQPWNVPIVRQVTGYVPQEKAALAQLQVVQSDSQAWYRDWATPALAQIGAGKPLTAAQIEDGRRRFDAIRAAYTSYVNNLRAGRDARAQHLHQLTNRLFYIVIASAVLALLGGLALWALMHRWVSKPVAGLAAETRTVTEGDLDHQVQIEGPPDLVALSADVEAMRRALVRQLAEAEQLQAEATAARASIQDYADELQRSNRELEQFAYVASHDLQEPLRKVASFCQMLERRYAGQLDERADQYIHFAVDGAKRMQRLINDLLEFSRVGRLTTPQSDISLQACLDSAMGNLETAREEAGAEITWDPLPVVRGEAALLTQLLQNVLGNAIKFRSEAPPKIHLGVRREGEFWQFSCADNGIGIAPEYAERVFLIFQRLHPKEEYSGTGIGLAMSKKIVEYHGGRIWIQEHEGPGTLLCWTLPVPVTPTVLPEAGAVQPAGAAS